MGSQQSNGGCEAYVELQKALNIVGDYRLSTSVNVLRWGEGCAGAAPSPIGFGPNASATQLNELDYTCSHVGNYWLGNPKYVACSSASGGLSGNSFCGNLGSACYVSAIDLETSNGVEISGLNAEEQVNFFEKKT